MVRRIGSRWEAALIAALAIVCLAPSRDARAGVPAQMIYQGFLTDANGTPRTGTFDMRFELFADSTGGSALWSEQYAAVPVETGVFGVVLGTVTPLPAGLFGGSRVWLETTVSDTTLAPRRPLASVAYAFRASVADSALRVAGGGDTLWSASGSDVYRLAGNVGIGTSSPSDPLMVQRSDSDPSNAIHNGLRLRQSGTGTVGLQLGGASTFDNWYVYRGWQNDFRIASSILGTPTDYFRIDPAGHWYVGNPVDASTQNTFYGRAIFNTGVTIPTGASAGYVLTSDGTGTGSWQPAAGTGAIGGSGTPDAIPKFTGATTLGNSVMTEVGGNVGVGAPTAAARLEVAASNPGIPGLRVRAASGQATDVQDWRRSDGSLLASLSANGVFSGDGSGLTALNAGQLTTGTVPSSRLGGLYPNPVTFSSAGNSITGNFTGAGTGITTLNASSLVTGTVPGTRLSGNYSNPVSFSSAGNQFIGTFTGSGTSLTGLNAGNITFGTLSFSRLPAGGTWGLSSDLAIGGTSLFVDMFNGRVGIGTTPTSKLDVQGGHVTIGSYGAVEGLHYRNSSGVATVYKTVLVQCGEVSVTGLGGSAGVHYDLGAVTFPVAFDQVLSVQLTADRGWYVPMYHQLAASGFSLSAASVLSTSDTDVVVKWCAYGVKN